MDFEQKEKELEEQINNLPHKPFEDVFAQIEPRLKKKSQKISGTKKLRLIIATAASIMLVLTGALVGYFWPKTNPDIPEYRYAESNVSLSPCDYDDLLSRDGLYLPDLSLLIEKTYQVGKHNETQEIVYFKISAIYDDGIFFRELEIYVILKKEFVKEDDNEYINLPKSFQIDDKTISCSESTYLEPFFNYKISFTNSDIRYYFNYNTIDEGDVESFFQEFLK